MGRDIECHRCNYDWDYGGEMPRATCPRCGAKVDTGIPIEQTPDESPDVRASVTDTEPSLEERKVEAFEEVATALTRIADALEDDTE
jgi:predicted  nucleic acid-binding Zn-ribbon protein